MTLTEYVNSIKNKRCTVVGIGVSNLPLIRLLAANSIDVTACDRRTEEKLECADELTSLGVKLSLGEGYLSDLQTDIIFRTPGLHPNTEELLKAVENGAVLTSEMEVFFDVCPCRIIAVTGSDGKTTTTTLISELLKRAGYTVHLGGNIGTPLLCSSEGFSSKDFAVVELSSFQLMTMKKRPFISVVTNIAPNHLDVHRDMNEYMEAKHNICKYQGPGDITVLNAKNEYTQSFSAGLSSEIRFFNLCGKTENGAFCNENDTLYYSDHGICEELFDTSLIRIPGRHNIDNYLAAYSAVHDFVSAKDLLYVAEHFGGVEHRIEFVREKDGVKYYNDSIASSPTRTIAGLHSFRQKVILIAGGKDKKVPFDALGAEILNHVKALVVTGFTKDIIEKAVKNAPGFCGVPEIYNIEDFKSAVLKASEIAHPGDIVLFSPACTSFDKFKNFAERGNTFKQIVTEM